MYHGEAGRPLLIFFKDYQGGIFAVRGEAGYLPDGEFVAVAVGGAADVGAVGEEGGEELGFVVEVGIDGGCD